MTQTSAHKAPRLRKRAHPRRETHQPAGPSPSSGPEVSTAPAPEAAFPDPECHAMISDAAYFLAEQRDFYPGHELDDWLAAEREIDQRLSAEQPGTGCGT